MQRTRCIVRWVRCQQGTASLEALLVLPVIFVVMTLLFESARGWQARMKANGAVRLAATQEIHLLQEDGATPAMTGEQMVRKFYFSELTEYRRTVSESELRLDFDAVPERWLERVMSLGPDPTVHVTLARQLPAGSLLPSTQVRAELAITGQSWTYGSTPLALGEAGIDQRLDGAARQGDGIRRLLGPFAWAAGPIFNGFFWLLGMEA